jgi:hypothetical protein
MPLTNNPNLDKVVVILSTGRTGTKALAHFFNTTYDNVTALHEPAPSRHLRLHSNRAMAKGMTPEHAIRTLGNARAKLLASLTRPVYIESNWYIYAFLDALRPVFGERTKVLHVVRDPRTYVPSMLNYGTYQGLKAVATRFLPYWYIRPEQVVENPPKRWAQMSEAERLAWHWHVVNKELDRAAGMFGGDYLFMRYEDLFAADGAGLTTLLPWIGLPENPALLEKIRGERVNASTGRNSAWARTDPAARRAVLEMCGEQMARYGYAPNDEDDDRQPTPAAPAHGSASPADNARRARA